MQGILKHCLGDAAATLFLLGCDFFLPLLSYEQKSFCWKDSTLLLLNSQVKIFRFLEVLSVLYLPDYKSHNQLRMFLKKSLSNDMNNGVR